MRKLVCTALCLSSLCVGAIAQSNDPPVASDLQHPASRQAVRGLSDGIYRAAQFAFAGSVALDLETTAHLPAGWAEGNPVLGRTRAQQLGMGVGLGLLTLWQAHRLEIEGHARAAKICLLVGAALHSSAASYNLTRPAKSTP